MPVPTLADYCTLADIAPSSLKAVTAGKTLIFDRVEMLELANRHRIAVVGSTAETVMEIST